MIIDQLDTINVTATSPDRTVVAIMSTTPSGLRVQLNPVQLQASSDAHLAGQLKAALTGAVKAYHKTCGLAVEYGGHSTSTEDPKLDEFLTAAERIVVVGVSPWGAVRVKWRGDGDIDVRVREGTVGRFNAARLSVDVNGAIEDAMRLYSSQIADLLNDAFNE